MKRITRWGSALLLAALLVACGTPEVGPGTTPTIMQEESAMPTAATAEEMDLVARAEALVDALAAGDAEKATTYFDATMLEALPPDQLSGIWNQLTAQVGPFQERLGTRTATQQGYDVVYVVTQFEAGPLDVKVVFDAEGQVAGLFFEPSQGLSEPQSYSPPTYANLEAIEEHEVTVGSGQWALPGTLTLPVAGDDLPAVVLVHGSGPQDRDETIGPNKPFRDLAWGLASQGVAVLRYEKRTKQYAAQLAEALDEFTVYEETVEDALVAVALLRETPRIDPERVFVLGHSLGGMVAPRIGALDRDLGGLIILAGNTRPLEDLLLEQLAYVGTPEEQLSEVEAQVARVKNPSLSLDTPASELLGVPASYWLDLRGYDPAEAAKNLPQPMLILGGGRDYQVTEADFDGWQAALGGRDDVSTVFYADLNHLFMAGEGMATPAEYERPGNVAQGVIDDIAAWVLAH
jgi:dienelactone hydrolase